MLVQAAILHKEPKTPEAKAMARLSRPSTPRTDNSLHFSRPTTCFSSDGIRSQSVMSQDSPGAQFIPPESPLTLCDTKHTGLAKELQDMDIFEQDPIDDTEQSELSVIPQGLFQSPPRRSETPDPKLQKKARNLLIETLKKPGQSHQSLRSPIRLPEDRYCFPCARLETPFADKNEDNFYGSTLTPSSSPKSALLPTK
ncbi:hypothetical protein PIIN_07717 [Serendipita indica DSM 11827]|uniref:Uncharacterized protein n=1 Tax=Serendipita indica (strain DSM 11827) TaxID=1109443 RepID=G4TR19_SERID|nr:hypothetical protein PIIN_07717 [Serendipita indica DSM 11827]